MTESVLVKLLAFTKTSSQGACNRASHSVTICFYLQAVAESVFSKALGIYNKW